MRVNDEFSHLFLPRFVSATLTIVKLCGLQALTGARTTALQIALAIIWGFPTPQTTVSKII